MNEMIKISVVQVAYLRTLRDKFKAYVTIPRVPLSGKLRDNALHFFDIAEKEGINPTSLMESAVGVYSATFYMKAFRRPYPPFHVATGEKVLSLALKQQPKVARMEKLSDKVNHYLNALKGLELSTAIEVVGAGGFCGGDMKVKEKILDELYKLKLDQGHGNGYQLPGDDYEM